MTSDSISVRIFNARGELVGPISMPPVVKSEEEWRVQLSEEQYRITRDSGTEPAFCGTLLDNEVEGFYTCVCCGLPLFSRQHEYEATDRKSPRSRSC